MSHPFRYTCDRTGRDTWIIIDQAHQRTPIAYLLMLTRLTGAGVFNRQINIARFDAADYGPREYHIFDYEVYSTIMYLQDAEVVSFVNALMYVLQGTEIECPVLLATQYGGIVRNHQLRMFPAGTIH